MERNINLVQQIVSQVITDAKKKQKNFKERMRSLNLLMQNRQIDNHLQMKVRKYIEYLQESDENIKNASKDMDLLPTSIKQDVQIDMYGNMIKNQKLFYLNFSEKTIEKLATIVNEISVGPGEVIFKSKDNPDSLYIVLSGRIEIFLDDQKQNEIQNEIHISYIEKGCIFGAEDFFYQRSRQNAAKANILSEIIQISRQQLESILKLSEDDYEKYKMLNDMVKYSSTTRGLGLQCHFCKNYSHSFSECPNVTYLKKKDQIIQKFNIHKDQIRESFQRNNQKSLNTVFFQPFLFKQIKLFFDLRSSKQRESENNHSGVSISEILIMDICFEILHQLYFQMKRIEDIIIEDEQLQQIITEYTQKIRNSLKSEEFSEIEQNLSEKQNFRKVKMVKYQENSSDQNDQILSSIQNNIYFSNSDEKDKIKGNSKRTIQNINTDEIISSTPKIIPIRPNSNSHIQFNNNSPTFNNKINLSNINNIFNLNQNQNPLETSISLQLTPPQVYQPQTIQLQNLQLSPPLENNNEFREKDSSLQFGLPTENKLFPNNLNEIRMNIQNSYNNLDNNYYSQNSNQTGQKNQTILSNDNKTLKGITSINQSGHNYSQQQIYIGNQQSSCNIQLQSPQLQTDLQRQKQNMQEGSLMKINTITHGSNLNTVGGRFESRPTQNIGSQLTAFDTNNRQHQSSINQPTFHSAIHNPNGIQDTPAERNYRVNFNTSNGVKRQNSNMQSNNLIENSIEITSIRAIKALNNWESDTMKNFDRYKNFNVYFPKQNLKQVLEGMKKQNIVQGKRNSIKKKGRSNIYKKYELMNQQNLLQLSPRKGTNIMNNSKNPFASGKQLVLTPVASENMNKSTNLQIAQSKDIEKS